MTASPTALDLARACVMTVDAGAMRSVRVVPPGTDPQHSVHWITVPADLAARYVEEAVAVLAPFIDLGMARGRAEGSRLEPLTDQDRHQIAAQLLELRAERDRAKSAEEFAVRERDEARTMAVSWERENEDLGRQNQALRTRCAEWEREADATYRALCSALDLPPGTTTGEILNRARMWKAVLAGRYASNPSPCPEPPRTIAPEVPYTVDDEDDQEVD